MAREAQLIRPKRASASVPELKNHSRLGTYTQIRTGDDWWNTTPATTPNIRIQQGKGKEVEYRERYYNRSIQPKVLKNKAAGGDY